MSWAQLYKVINRDIKTPLNVLQTILHIDLVGNVYKGRYDFNQMIAIMNSDVFYVHPTARKVVSEDFWDYVVTMDKNVGTILSDAFKITSDDLRKCNTFRDIALDENLLKLVYSNERLALSLSENTNTEVFAKLLDNRAMVGYRLTRPCVVSLTTTPSLANTMTQDYYGLPDFYQNKVTIINKGAGTYTVPNGVYFITVAAVGYGSNGGVGDSFTSLGTFGVGGEYIHRVLDVSPGQTIAYNIPSTSGVVTFGSISARVGLGRTSGASPAQKGELLITSDIASTTAAGNGYGGGAGGAGADNSSTGTAVGYAGNPGVVGVGFLGSSAGTGGSPGASGYRAQAGVDGGGGGGGLRTSQGNTGRGGGAGYGGGGAAGIGNGGGGGLGGSGCIVVFQPI